MSIEGRVYSALCDIRDINSILKYEIPNELQKKVPELQVQHVVLKRPPYIHPSPYIISVSMLLCNLGMDIDIDRRSFYYCIMSSGLIRWDDPGLDIELNGVDPKDKNTYTDEYRKQFLPGILYIQYSGISCGDTEFMKQQNKSVRRKTFNNSCTMRICFETSNDGYNVINLKLFNNGTIQITGIKSMVEAKDCVEIISDRVKRLMKLSRVHKQLLDICKPHDPSLIMKHHLLTEYLELHDNNIEGLRCFKKILCDRDVFANFMRYLPQVDVRSLSMSCKTLNVFFHHSNHKLWKYLLDNATFNAGLSYVYSKKKYNVYELVDGYVNLRNVLKPEQLKSRYFVLNESYKPNMINYNLANVQPEFSNSKIEMINSNFFTHFYINRKKIFKLIQRDYPYMNISFDPDDKYHGVKIYWPHPDTVKENGDSRDTVHIFISIFRTGSVLMSGAKTTGQLDDAYKFINGLLKKYYKEIWLPSDLKTKK